MLEELLYPHFGKEMGLQPLSWRTLASAFVRLRGVKKQQLDRRSGYDRSGPMPVVYRIPKPRRPAVEPVRTARPSIPPEAGRTMRLAP